MAENDSFPNGNEKTIDIEHKDGLLEELDLPPNVIKFIRKNNQAIIGAIIGIVVLILGWTYYDYHVQSVANDASAALNAAILEPDSDSRMELLKNVENDYSGTEAASWSRIERAHLLIESGDFTGGLAIYNEALDDLGSGNPLTPLLHYNAGLACENGGDLASALDHYVSLASFKGFEAKGLIAQGRVRELQGDLKSARDLFEKAAGHEDVSAQDKMLLQDKLDSMDMPVSTPEAG